MAIYNDAEIERMLVDWGNILTAGEVTAPCILDDADVVDLDRPSLASYVQAGGGGQIVRKITAIIRTSDFPALKANDAVSVDGRDYTVWDRMKHGDGGLTELTLRIDESGS